MGCSWRKFLGIVHGIVLVYLCRSQKPEMTLTELEVKACGASLKEAKGVVVFIHGWPDSIKIWDKVLPSFLDEYHCLLMTLPGFSQDKKLNDVGWGHSFEELTTALWNTVNDKVGENSKVYLVSHDWGSVLAYRMASEQPARVIKMSNFDIGYSINPRWFGVLIILIYQTWNVVAFLIGGSSGDWMTRKMVSALGAPLGSGSRVHSGMCSMYWQLYKQVFLESALYKQFFLRKDTEVTPKFSMKLGIPLCFLYASKGVRFHSPRMLNSLEKRESCHAEEIKGTHWFLYSKKQGPYVGNLVKTWFEKK
jgi:pimeloyl-ACP methyl ester carboxylesterase